MFFNIDQLFTLINTIKENNQSIGSQNFYRFFQYYSTTGWGFISQIETATTYSFSIDPLST